MLVKHSTNMKRIKDDESVDEAIEAVCTEQCMLPTPIHYNYRLCTKDPC